jgi:hypothetical protein
MSGKAAFSLKDLLAFQKEYSDAGEMVASVFLAATAVLRKERRAREKGAASASGPIRSVSVRTVRGWWNRSHTAQAIPQAGSQ